MNIVILNLFQDQDDVFRDSSHYGVTVPSVHTIRIVEGQPLFQSLPFVMAPHCSVVPLKVIVWSALQVLNA